MKKYIVASIIFLFPAITYAATKPATPSATGVSKEVQNKIDDLKERLATKVAELRKTTPRAIYGTITQVSVTSFTVDAAQKAYKVELTDDIKVAQMIKGKRTALTNDDLAKNDNVTIVGDYDETLDVLQAKNIFIEASKLPVRLHGTITEIDKKNNAFTLKGIDDANYTIDVEATTKNSLWTKEKGIEKGGFSKLETGMYATVVGLENAKQADRYSAVRLLVFTMDVPTSTNPVMEDIATPSATPTTAKSKLSPTPTKKATVTTKPSATPKATSKPTP